MKALAVWLLLGACCIGCGRSVRMESVPHTAFFLSHDARAYFEAIARDEGYRVLGGGSGHAAGGPTGTKEFSITIEGDEAVRDRLMLDYKEIVEGELLASGVSINGRGVTGEVSGFDFRYQSSGATGLVRVNAPVDRRGYIQVDVFIYEHK